MSAVLTYQSRLRAIIGRCGEAFDLTQAGVPVARIGVFGVADPDTVASYFDPPTAAGLTRPVLTLTLDGASPPPTPGDTLVRDGRTLTVRVVDAQRLSGTTVAYYALLD